MLSLFSPGTFLLFFFSAHSNFSPLSVLLCWKVVCLHSFEHLFFFFEYSHIIEEQRRNANEEEGEECFFFPFCFTLSSPSCLFLSCFVSLAFIRLQSVCELGRCACQQTAPIKILEERSRSLCLVARRWAAALSFFFSFLTEHTLSLSERTLWRWVFTESYHYYCYCLLLRPVLKRASRAVFLVKRHLLYEFNWAAH